MLIMVCEPSGEVNMENGYPNTFPSGLLEVKDGVYIINGKLQYGPSGERNTWSSEDNLKALKKIQSGD